MQRFSSSYRVRLKPETKRQVEELAAALGRSEGELMRRLIEVALTAPAPVLQAAGLAPTAGAGSPRVTEG